MPRRHPVVFALPPPHPAAGLSFGGNMVEETPRRASAWGIVIASIVNLVASIAALFAFGLLLKALAPNPNPPLGIALIAAETILVPLLVWLVFHFAYRRHRAPRRPIVTFLIILAGTLVLNGSIGGVAYVALKRDQAQRLADRTTQEDNNLRKVLAESNAAAAALNATNDTPIDLATGAPGELGRIARGAKAMLRGLNAARAGFDDTMHALGYPDLMAASKLEGAGRLENALSVFAKIRTALTLRDTQIDTVERDYRALLAGAGIDPAQRKAALDYLDGQIALEKASRAKYDDLSRRILDEYTAQIHDLKASRPAWMLHNGGFLFADQRDYDRSVRHQHTIMALARELKKLLGH
jgi:hypothetical protein